jgi:iron complex transport system ATP-binding protein
MEECIVMSGKAAPTGLEVRELTLHVGGRMIVDAATFDAPAAAVTALIGPNGAGKSTLLRAITSSLRGSAGMAVLNGEPLSALPRRVRARRIALVEQDSVTELGLRVRDVVGLGRIPFQSAFGGESPDDTRIVDAALEAAGMTTFSDRDFATLSGGERQRVQLARALAQQPLALLLDEPTNHLDLPAQLSTLRLVRERAAAGTAVLAAMHDLNLVSAYCDRVVVLQAGRVVAQGGVREVLTADLIAEVYGVEVDVLHHPVSGRPVLALATP